jgi:hypothetical protein
MSDFEFPNRGFVFWPVGCGDSTTIAIEEDVVVQIDLHHVEDSEKDDDPRIPVVDELVELLPTGNDGKPYLAAFGATHLDKDHIQGFAELLERVTIGDLWFTPRVLWEQDQDELCDDAEAFVEEAERRIKKMKAEGAVGSGHRIRIIGFSDTLKEHSDIYKDLPEGSVTVPGSEFHSIDGDDHSEVFRAFVHAPFKEDAEAERNHTSFGLQITLTEGDTSARALLLGDLSYPTLKRIFERSEDDDLAWDIFLAPHHCSKSAMYGRDEGETEDSLKQDLLDKIESAAGEDARIVASAPPIPEKDEDGANPPHLIAAQRYREIVPADHFLCTGEHPNAEEPEPITFAIGEDGVSLRAAAGLSKSRSSTLPGAVETARGASRAPAAAVGFGRH